MSASDSPVCWQEPGDGRLRIVGGARRWRELDRPEAGTLVGVEYYDGSPKVRWRSARPTVPSRVLLLRAALLMTVPAVAWMLVDWGDLPGWSANLGIAVIVLWLTTAFTALVLWVPPDGDLGTQLIEAKVGIVLQAFALVVWLLLLPIRIVAEVPDRAIRRELELVGIEVHEDADAHRSSSSPVFQVGEARRREMIGTFPLLGREANFVLARGTWPFDIGRFWSRRVLAACVELAPPCAQHARMEGSPRDLLDDPRHGRAIEGESVEAFSVWTVHVDRTSEVDAWTAVGPQLQALLIELPRVHFSVDDGLLTVAMSLRDGWRDVGFGTWHRRAERTVLAVATSAALLASVLERQRFP